MPEITFIHPNGDRVEVSAADGVSLMEAARNNNVDGILAECGGACACATCHIIIEDGPVSALEPATPMEEAMLEGALNATPQSRLACQIPVSGALDGLVVSVPESQF